MKATTCPTLDQLAPGQSGLVASVAGQGAVLQRLLEMGITEGEPVEVVALAPLGDPMEIRIRGFELSLRKRDAALVGIESATT